MPDAAMGRSLAVVGTSLVSPLGITAAEHAFFVRAGIGPAAPGGFLDAEGDTLAVAYCPWLGASVPIAARVRLLAERALDGVDRKTEDSSAPKLRACQG
jgi:hypothetical protein